MAGGALGYAARELYGLLLQPAQASIDRASRVLLLPDGSLHALPFALLERPGDGRLLVEQQPLSQVASFTLLAELRRRAASAAAGWPTGRPLGRPLGRVVLADPAPADDAVGSPVLTRAAMAPLPAARGEAAAVAARARPATVLLGEQASERAAKGVSGPLQALHFAAHVVLDERLPLSSGIVLAPDPAGHAGPGRRENGLLQAWEVFEEVRVAAELVALSGCRSALGPERPGEGLLGLVRAFQFAGARAVLASKWKVDDAATAQLMRRFYRELDRGLAADEALRRAQLEMLEEPGLLDRIGAAFGRPPARPHPFHWAAFALDGDVPGAPPTPQVQRSGGAP